MIKTQVVVMHWLRVSGVDLLRLAFEIDPLCRLKVIGIGGTEAYVHNKHLPLVEWTFSSGASSGGALV